MKRLTMPLIVISIFLLLSLTVSAYTIYTKTPQWDASLWNYTVVAGGGNPPYRSWNSTRSALVGAVDYGSGASKTYSLGAYGEASWDTTDYYTLYRIFQSYDLTGVTIPSGYHISNASLNFKLDTSYGYISNVYVFNSSGTKEITKANYNKIHPLSGDISKSSGVGTYPLNNWLGYKAGVLPNEAWSSIPFTNKGVEAINRAYTSTYFKIIIMLGNDTMDTYLKDNLNLWANMFSGSASVGSKPYIWMNVSLCPMGFKNNGSNISKVLRTGQKAQMNFTGLVFACNTARRFNLTYSSYKDGIGYYYGHIDPPLWTNNSNEKRTLKINYSDGGWFYYRFDFNSSNGLSMNISENYTNLHYNPSYFYLLGNWSNLTQTTQPNKYYNFTSTLRTNGYPQICKYWYEAGAVKNNITFACNKGTNTTIKNQTKFLLTNFSFAGWYRWKFWANTTTGVSNASKWSNISGYSFTFVDNCTHVKNKTMNIYFYDEDYPSHELNTTLELTLNTTDPFGFPVRYSAIMNGKHNYSLCFNENFTGAYTDVYMKYYSEDYYPNLYYNRFYYFNKSLNATVTNLILYALNTTSGLSVLKVTARHEADYSLWSGIIGLLQRHYVSEGVWRTVQAFQSDNFGQLLYYVREANQDYRIVYYDKYNNRYQTMLYQTPSSVFICTSGLCDYTELITPIPAYTTSGRNIGLTYSYNNVTGILTVNWNDPESLTTSVNMQVLQYPAEGTDYICNTTQLGASGTMTCDVSLYNGAVFLKVFSTGSPKRWEFSTWIQIIKDIYLANMFPQGVRESAFWGFIISFVIVGAGFVAGIVGAILFSVVGLIVAYYGHLVGYLTYGMIVLAVIIAMFIGVKLRR